MNRLEERYRRVLRLLPASYRARWEDEMVEAFLTSVESYDPDRAEFLAEFGRPSAAEVASVAALSLRLRLGLAGTPTPRAAAWGGAWRFVALAWLLANAVLVTAPLLGVLWIPRLIARVAGLDGDVVVELPPGNVVWQYLPLLWTVAFFALLLGWLRVARITAALVVAREVLALLAYAGAGYAAGASPVWLFDAPTVAFHVGLLATLWAFAPGQPVVRRRTPWVLAFVAAVGVVSAHLALVVTTVVRWSVVDLVDLLAVGVVLAAVVHLSRRRRYLATTLGLAVVAGIVLVQRLALEAVRTAGGWTSQPDARAATVVQVAALALVAVALIVLGARALARTRSDTPATTA